ncbi:hypothetical protein [Phormidium nigroviride]
MFFRLKYNRRKKEEGRRKKEEGRRKKEEGRRKKEEGRRKMQQKYVWAVETATKQTKSACADSKINGHLSPI